MKRKLLLYGLIRVTRRENHDKSNTSMALRGAEFGKMGKKEPFRGQKSRTPVDLDDCVINERVLRDGFERRCCACAILALCVVSAAVLPPALRLHQ
jgi:hypothetical protein